MKGLGRTACGATALVLALLVFFVSPASAGPELDTSNPVAFFTNLASRLLKAEMNLDLHRLQIYPTNQYTPAVHRLLQVTANLYDAINPTNDAFGPLPTVFRPRFKTEGGAVFIEGYEEVASFNPFELSPQPLDLSFTNAVAYVKSNSLIFGVPFVIGARKGLPNFNEFASESVVQITRKLELRKTGPGGGNLINQTNQMFIIGISNGFGAEFWNSYTSNYTRPVEVAVINFSLLQLTNDFGFVLRSNLTASGQIFIPSGATSVWSRWTRNTSVDASFLVPLRSNHIVIPDSAYSQVTHTFKPLPAEFEPTPATPVVFPLPRWGLTITNRVVAFIRDSATSRLLDYVQLSSMTSHRDLTAEMAADKHAQGFDGLWATNSPDGMHLSDRFGVINQIQISRGEFTSGLNEWQSHGFNQPAGATKDQEIARFRAFFTPDNRATYNGFPGVNTNLTALSPFTPTWKQSMPMIWQANDPLIHYTTRDMEYLERSGMSVQWVPPSKTNFSTLNNLGRVNERYRPWGGNPFATGGGSSIESDLNAYNHAFKDPLVRSANNWDFPEGEPLSLALLRRVHRGTPWQTIYLKASMVTNSLEWRKWTGSRDASNAEQSVPTRDWKIAALITSLINTNHPRALLSVNERDPNAWLAVLDGIVALTNSATAEMLDNFQTQFDPITLTSNSPQAALLAGSIQAFRDARPNQRFNSLDEFLAVAALTDASPVLNHGVMDEFGHNRRHELSISDEAYERIPVQLLSRLRPDSFGTIAPNAGGWRLQFTGADGFSYAIESSTNLAAWQAIATNQPTNGVIEMELPPEVEKSFFRSVLLP